MSESQGQNYLKANAKIRLGAAGAFHREITIEGSVVRVNQMLATLQYLSPENSNADVFPEPP